MLEKSVVHSKLNKKTFLFQMSIWHPQIQSLAVTVDREEIVLAYITLGETVGVPTKLVQAVDNGVSLPTNVQFHFGSHIESTVYVCSNINYCKK